jgi:hypothetical protein
MFFWNPPLCAVVDAGTCYRFYFVVPAPDDLLSVPAEGTPERHAKSAQFINAARAGSLEEHYSDVIHALY